MSEREPRSKFPVSRRAALKGGSAAVGGALLLPRNASANPPQAGIMGELDASAPGGIDLVLERKDLLIGGRVGHAIAINGSIPGPVIRMKEGKGVLIRVHNRLNESTSVHWHGMLVPFTMDGVPGISFPGIGAGETFTYRYKVRQNGTYWYHSHSGFQEQLGVYGQLIVEPSSPDPIQYDVEHSVVLSDWTFENPATIFSKLKKIDGYFNFQRATTANLNEQVRNTKKSLSEAIAMRLRWDWMRMDPTDIADVTGITYSFLLNGQTSAENPTLLARPGQRVRLRILNASSQTYYDFRIPGLPMTVVQADGQNVKPVETDELRIAVAETYDVIVTLPDAKAYTLFAETMDRSGSVRGTLAPTPGMSAEVPGRRPRSMLGMEDMGMMHDMPSGDMNKGSMDHGSMNKGSMDHGSMDHAPPPAAPSPLDVSDGRLATMNLPEMIPHGPKGHGPASITMAKNVYRQLDDPGLGLGKDGWRVLTYGQLRALTPPPGRRPPTREINLHLTGNMAKFIWGFDGKKWSESKMIRFVFGERLRINFLNDTMMSHPMHLHGMWMDLYAGHEYSDNPRKHTVNVQPAELLTVDITADAPGQWAFHCHLLYHMEAGMFRTVAVVKSLQDEASHAEG